MNNNIKVHTCPDLQDSGPSGYYTPLIKAKSVLGIDYLHKWDERSKKKKKNLTLIETEQSGLQRVYQICKNSNLQILSSFSLQIKILNFSFIYIFLNENFCFILINQIEYQKKKSNTY